MRPDRTSWPRWRQTCSPGSCLARAAAGLADATIVSDVVNLEQIRVWFGRPLWEMEPPDADAYFGKVLRSAAKGTRQARSRALRVYFLFLEIRHKVEIHQLTGRVVECPIDEINRPRGAGRAALRIPPSAVQMEVLFAGWRQELATCRKFASCRPQLHSGPIDGRGRTAGERGEPPRSGRYQVGPGPVREASCPKRQGRPRIRSPRTHGAVDQQCRGHPAVVCRRMCGAASTRTTPGPGAPLFSSERRNADGTAARVGNETLRSTLTAAAATHLPDWPDRVTPHVLRHFCASQLYLGGMDLVAIQQTLGHVWVATTMNYIHVQATHIEDAWIAGQQRAADRLTGLVQ